jgi:hypothetical protein
MAAYSITSLARNRKLSGIEAERLGGVEVDNKLVFDRLLNRKIGRLGAFEDAINIAGRPLDIDPTSRSRRISTRPQRRNSGSQRLPAACGVRRA